MWIIASKKNVLNFVVISVFSDFSNKRLNPSYFVKLFCHVNNFTMEQKTFRKLLWGSLTHLKRMKKCDFIKKITSIMTQLSDFAVILKFMLS